MKAARRHRRWYWGSRRQRRHSYSQELLPRSTARDGRGSRSYGGDEEEMSRSYGGSWEAWGASRRPRQTCSAGHCQPAEAPRGADSWSGALSSRCAGSRAAAAPVVWSVTKSCRSSTVISQKLGYALGFDLTVISQKRSATTEDVGSAPPSSACSPKAAVANMVATRRPRRSTATAPRMRKKRPRLSSPSLTMASPGMASAGVSRCTSCRISAGEHRRKSGRRTKMGACTASSSCSLSERGRPTL
eukprot:scaffold37992_cov60-Phaeocystis_antarctica.AAC.5